MKVDLKKIGAIVAGATILASSVAFAGLQFQNTQLVNDNGQPVVKVVVGEKAAASDGVAAANIAAKIANEAYKTQTLTAQVKGTPTCAAGAGAGTCKVSAETVTLEVTVPGTTSTDVATVSSLIGDYYSRTLLDRGAATQDTYTMSTSETSTEANPFATSTGSYFGQNIAKLYRIDGSNFNALKSYSFDDKDAGKTYKEYQAFYVYGNNQYRATDDQVDVRLSNLVYQVKFNNDNYGLALCSDSSGKDWAYCLGTDGGAASTDLDVSKQLASHKVKVKFLGSDWVITKTLPPSTAAVNETVVVSGGEVDLASEAVSGIVNVGDTLEAANGYKVKLDDIKSGTTASEQSAIVSILDSAGTVIKQTTVSPGNTASYTTSDGTKILVRVYKTAPGYTFGAKWADMALINNELVLKDGDAPAVNGDTSVDTAWKVSLGWKNKDVDTTTAKGNQSDYLRSIIIYHDGATDYMKKGDAISVLDKPTGYKVTFGGLDLVSDDYDTLKFDEYDGDFSFVPDGNTTSVDALSTSYVKVTSTVDSAFSTSQGTGKELVYLFDAGTNRNASLLATTNFPSAFTANLTPGSVLLKLSNGKYTYVGNMNQTGGLGVQYLTAGSAGTVAGGGRIIAGYSKNDTAVEAGGNSGYGPGSIGTLGSYLSNWTLTDPSGGAGNNDSVVFVLSEDAGEGLSAQKPDAIGFWYQLSTKSFNKDSGATTRFAKDKFTWASAQNFSAVTDDIYGNSSMPTTEEVNFVTERGTIAYDKSDSSVTLKVPKKVGHAQLLFAPSGVETSSTKQIFTGGEGADFDAGQGVKIHVKSIDETVGACSVGTGAAPSCTVDSSGVSAVIMGDGSVDGVSEFKAMVPYGSVGSLVVLDKDAVDTDAVVTVGGPAVNSVTKSALEGSAVDFAATPKVVKEVVAGKKIVVAGMSASDTLEAAKDFVAALKKQ